MKLTAKQKFERTVDWLRKEFPSILHSRPENNVIEIYVEALAIEAYGYARKHGYAERNEIHISNKIPWDFRLHVLLHEWAHILIPLDIDSIKECKWDSERRAAFHDDKWALCHVKIYRAYLKWQFGFGKKEKNEPQNH